MAHTCPDGTHTRLIRTGPVGTMEGVEFHCPRCGYTKSGLKMWADSLAAKDKIIAALSGKA